MTNDCYSKDGSPEPIAQALMLVGRFCRVVNALDIANPATYSALQQKSAQLMIASYHIAQRDFDDAELETIGTVNGLLNDQLEVLEHSLFAGPAQRFDNFYEAYLGVPVEGEALTEMVTSADPEVALQKAAFAYFGAPVFFDAALGGNFSLSSYEKTKQFLIALIKALGGATGKKIIFDLIANVLDALDDMYANSLKIPKDDKKGGETAPCKIYIYLMEVELADTSVGDDWFIDFKANINGADMKIPRVTLDDLPAGATVQDPPVLLASATGGLCGQNQAITISMTPTEDDYYDDVGSPASDTRTIRCPNIAQVTLTSQVTDQEESGTPTTNFTAKLLVVLRCD